MHDTVDSTMYITSFVTQSTGRKKAFYLRLYGAGHMIKDTGVARPSGTHGQESVMGRQTNGLILVGGRLDPRGPWSLSTMSTRLLSPFIYMGYSF